MAERQVFGTDLNKQGRLIPTPLLRVATICYRHDKKDVVVNWDSNLGSNRIERLAQQHPRCSSYTRVSFGKLPGSGTHTRTHAVDCQDTFKIFHLAKRTMNQQFMSCFVSFLAYFWECKLRMKEIINETCLSFRSWSISLPSELFFAIVSSKTVRTNEDILTLWYMFGFGSFRHGFCVKSDESKILVRRNRAWVLLSGWKQILKGHRFDPA